MNNLFLRHAFLLLITALLAASPAVAETYEPNWESLRKGRAPAPDWFRDAKFGIYFHWGVYSVPAFGNEWYPRKMYDPQEKVHEHHKATYGAPCEYGYDRFVDQFKAEQFDAEEWVNLFAKSGAKFVGPVAEHHDGFAMWGSKTTPWNAVDRGPKRDIVQEIADAARERDLKFVATFHHARNRLWKPSSGREAGKWTGHFSHAMERCPQALEDAERAVMYGHMPEEKFLAMWLEKLREVIDATSPDLIWFDSWLHEIPEKTRQEFLAYYFNHAVKNGKEVLVTYKQEDMPQDICVLDLEKGGMGELTEFTWLTDDTLSLGSWCYTEDLKIKSPLVVIHNLIDIVSKNGQLLLNISPRADGVIPGDQRAVLLAVGEWLEKHGEAIYGTRPFSVYGHGPTTARKGHYGGIATDRGYSAEDLRYTTKGDAVYAIQLGESAAGEKIVLEGFKPAGGASAPKVTAVTRLGDNAKIAWEQTEAGVTLTAAKPLGEVAVAYKLTVTQD